MDEEEMFHGFAEDDEVRTTVQDKLDWINGVVSTFEKKEDKVFQTNACSSNQSMPVKPRPKRPPNRFLRRSGGSPCNVPVKIKAEDDKSVLRFSAPSSDTRMAQLSLTQGRPFSVAAVPSKISDIDININGSSGALFKDKLPPMPSLVKYTPVKLPKPPALKKINVQQNELESTMPLLSPNEPTQNTNSKSTTLPRRVNKFLKVKSSNSVNEISKTNGDVAVDNTKVKAVDTILPGSPASSHSSNSINQEGQLPAKEVPNIHIAQKAVVEIKKVNAPPTPHEIHQPAVETGGSSNNEHVEKSELDMNKPSMTDKQKLESNQVIEQQQQSPTTKARGSKPPSPAKRASSTSELNFLNGQTSRSKRTIVPNKRFFSTDDSPFAAAKQEDKSSTVRRGVGKPVHTESMKKTTESIVIKKPQEEFVGHDRTNKGKRKRNFSAETNCDSGTGVSSELNEVKISKKRAESVDTANTKRKRTLSIENDQIPVADDPSNNQIVDAPGSSELTARPRRTIIPNRKFLDEVEPPKEAGSKKSDLNEPKRKRRKSEKNAQTVMQPVENDEVTHNLCESIADNSSISSGASAVESLDIRSVVTTGTCEPVSASSSNVSSNVKKVNGAKTEFKSKVLENDELPLDEAEEAIYRGNSLFWGACMLKTSAEIQASNETSSETGVICCGICGRIKKYRALAEKRKRGAFLCSHCGDVVNRIFSTAMKAKPFSCIVGPPVCEGSCPILFTPSDQFCEACFAKTCLKNLPMKDDIYFKIWRAIPPMSRGCVSTTPVVNPATPNVGKVVQINESGAIGKTTNSLKLLGPKKANHNGIDVTQDDSNSSDKIGDVDLISARITTFSHRTDSASSSNCENTIPLNGIDESHSIDSANNVKATGVSKEEMLLGRQTGQERVKALIDPIVKPDVDDVEIFGFPVVVSGTAYPRKPLCFLCGSSGIEQLIFCSQCCEPFHPYCAGDDILLDTYISRYDCQESQTLDSNCVEEDVDNCASSYSAVTARSIELVVKNDAEPDDSRIIVKWTCRRCMACKCCGVSIGREELIRCSRCRSPYHLQTCIDKKLLSKIKDLDKLRKLWTCDTCMKCKSCGKQMESIRRVQPIKLAGEDGEVDSEVSSQGSYLMLCIDCFKQRKKGSFCPFCDVSYDDNDWDSKMMECCKCNRWIHSTCENLSDEEYHVLGTLPDYIEYICRLCDPADNPIWYNSIQSQITKECNSVVRLFEKKLLGSFRKKRSSIEMKPTYVCNLFGDTTADDDADSTLSTLVPSDDDDDDNCRKDFLEVMPKDECITETPRLRKNIRKVSGDEILKCRVHLRDFVEFPQTLQEHWYALKVLGVEILNKFQDLQEVRTPKTPIHNTPIKCFTPTKYVSSVCDSIRSAMTSITSLRMFQNVVIRTIKNSGEEDVGVENMMANAKEAMQEVFPWFAQDWSTTVEVELQTSSSVEDQNTEDCIRDDDHGTISTNPFKEIFWNPFDFFDNRVCILCSEVGDFPPDSCGRLLWAGLNEWIHCNCALWSSEVFELETGALQAIGTALNRGRSLRCAVCSMKGATVSCCHRGCKQSFHFLCAREANCSLFQDQRMFCPRHPLSDKQQDAIQHDLKIGRKVFVDLEWLQKRDQKACAEDTKVFVGSLRVDSIGHLLPISVTSRTWGDSNSTFLIPANFKAQRVFWSSDEPWQKQCYTFETGISSNEFGNKVHDVGINLVVDHTDNEENERKGLHNISKFHQWVLSAPKYVDENLIDWLPRCSKVFGLEYDELDMFSSKRKTSCSPVSISSFSSFNRATPTSRFQASNSRTMAEGIEHDLIEAMSTEGYCTSGDDSNRNSTKVAGKNKKRRRSTCKQRSKKRHQFSNKETLSPRRRSMRNRRLLEESSEEVCAVRSDKTIDSDDDSGVVEGSSATGSCDGDIIRCRVNLLRQFNDSTDVEIANNDMMSQSSSLQSLFESPDEGDFQFYSCTSKSDNEVYHAAIKFGVKSDKSGSCFHSCDAVSAWMYVFENVSKSRVVHNLTSLTQPTIGTSVTGDKLKLANSFRMFGITHRSVQYLAEQLPGVINVIDKHTFQYSHRPYIDPENEDVPVKLNSTGCARTEVFKGRKPFDMFGFLASRHRKISMSCNLPEDTCRNQGLPLAMRFRDLRENSTKSNKRFVVLHSHIHGRGLYARSDIEKGDIIIEYAGEVIRPSLTDLREKYYESRGIGCYMFRINDTQVIDATLKGNAARFINHSCEPNCEAKTIRILGKDHILIFALRKIFKGEELTYDYKFEREEKKIPCTCGAARCRKYMN